MPSGASNKPLLRRQLTSGDVDRGEMASSSKRRLSVATRTLLATIVATSFLSSAYESQPKSPALRVAGNAVYTKTTDKLRQYGGEIVGSYIQVGGPVKPGGKPAPSRPVQGTIWAYSNSSGSGKAAAIVQSSVAGRFLIRLHPGVYYLYSLDRQIRPQTRVTTGVAYRVTLGGLHKTQLRVIVP